MTTSRSSTAEPATTRTAASSPAPRATTRAASRKKAAEPVVKKPAPKRVSRSGTAAAKRTAADKRKAAEMLRELKIDGEALSAQIERLRDRFL